MKNNFLVSPSQVTTGSIDGDFGFLPSPSASFVVFCRVTFAAVPAVAPSTSTSISQLSVSLRYWYYYSGVLRVLARLYQYTTSRSLGSRGSTREEPLHFIVVCACGKKRRSEKKKCT